jgi:oxygen-independent coproporphyrinogen III oxidase
MCDLAVDLEEVCGRHGRAVGDLAAEIERLSDFAADGLLLIEGGRLQATETGRLVIRSICAAFDTYFAAAEGRHSKAL